MTVKDIIQQCSQLAIELNLKDGKLQVLGNKKNLTPVLVEQLKGHRDEIMAYLMDKDTSTIHPRPTTEPLALSNAQTRLWSLDQLADDGRQYNMPAAFTVAGELNSEYLEQALNHIVSRHEPLRTEIIEHNGRPEARLAEGKVCQLQHQDLSGLSADEQPEAINKVLKEQAGFHFDLRADLLLRASLIRLSPTSQLLTFTMHHIAFDDASVGLFVKELVCYYNALVQGQALLENPLPIRYHDYAVWQSNRIGQGQFESMLDYWQQHLLSAPSHHSMPVLSRRGQIDSRGVLKVAHIDESLASQFEAIAKGQGLTPFMAYFAVFSFLIMKMSQTEDVVIGTPVAGREQNGLDDLIGMFVNSLPVRFGLDMHSMSVSSYFAHCREMLMGAMSHQDVPFDLIVDRVNPQRSAAQLPLFQIMFAMGYADIEQLKLADCELSAVDYLYQPAAKFDISMDLLRTPNGAKLTLEYKQALFDQGLMDVLLEGMALVIGQIANTPDMMLRQLSLLSDQSKQQHGFALHGPVADISDFFADFAKIVADTPAQIAISDEHGQLSYQQLDKDSDSIAATLQANGLKAEDIVALTGTRGCSFISAILGIIKAGGVYLPLSTGLPLQRKQQLLQLSRSAFLMYVDIDKASVDEILKDNQQCTALSVTQCVRSNNEFKPVKPQPRQLVYCVFTSGSTGVPKGALSEYQGFCAHNQSVIQHMGLTASDVVAQTADVAFDISVWQMLTPLTVGARIQVFNDEQATEPQLLAQTLNDTGVTLVQLVPTILRLMLKRINQGHGLTSIRLVISTGEALTATLAREWLQSNPNIPLLNAYGPAECSDDVTFHTVNTLEDFSDDAVPIGMAVDNTNLYLLDPYMQPVAPGMDGELYIGGTQLGRGYCGQSELTGASFVPDPFSTQPGARLYRTGDIARLDGKGRLVYQGRADFQVKINGQRVELGEIEAAINRFASVKDSLVKIGTCNHGNEVLTAYVQTEDQGVIATLNDALAQYLPVHMNPSAYVVIEQWPLTPNGKIDRKALPAPVMAVKSSERVAPINEMEQLLVDIWSEALNTDDIGTHDNFFALSGDSILGIQIAGMLRAAGWSISSRDIYRYQTISELAKVVKPLVKKQSQGPSSGIMTLSPIQQSFFNLQDNQVSQFNQSVCLSAPAGLDDDFWISFIDAMVSKHDVLRLAFTCHQQQWQARFMPWDQTKSQAAFSSYPPSQEDRSAILAQMDNSLSIEQGQLFKFGYIAGDESAQLLMVFHHLVIDGVSWRILLQELESVVKAHLNGQPFDLGLKTCAFADWSAHLQQAFDKGTVDDEALLWQKVNQHSSSLPTDMSCSDALVETTQVCETKLDKTTTQQLLTVANQAYGCDVNELLLVALALAAKHQWQQPAILVDLESHGRFSFDESLDLSGTLGWFTSIYPVVINADSDDLAQLLIEGKENLRRLPQGGVGFTLLQHIAQEPVLPNVKAPIEFNYLGTFEQNLDRDALFGREFIEYGSFEGEKRKRRHQLVINALVLNGELKIDVDYSDKQYQSSTIDSLVAEFVNQITSLVAHCQAQSQRIYTPVDFPRVDVSLEQLSQWQQHYGEISALYPCTPMQQGMIFHSMMDEDKQTYNSVNRVKLRGQLDQAKFKQAWQSVVASQPILRTRFCGFDRQTFIQLVTPWLDFAWSEQNQQDMSDKRQQKWLEQKMAEEKSTSFDLENGPLMRFCLIQTEAQRFDLVWTYHHVILDGWCLALIFEQVMSTYRNLVEGNTVDTTEISRYDGYLDWLESQNQQQVIDWWVAQMDGIDLPSPVGVTNLPETYQQPQAFAQLDTLLSAEHTEALECFAREHQCTLSAVVQLAWGYLLHRYSGIDDVVFGVTVAGRPAEVDDIENILGLFINTMPLKVSFANTNSLTAILQQISQGAAAANENSFVPLAKIQQAVSEGRPLFESLVVFENYPLDLAQLAAVCPPQLQVDGLEVEEQSNYPLTLLVTPGEQLDIQLVYQQAQYTSLIAEQMLEGFKQVLLSLITTPKPQLTDMNIYNVEQQNHLVEHWNQTKATVEQGVGLHQLFERQAAKTPDYIAVKSRNGQYTYGQLELAANALAHQLIDAGVKPTDLVPVCMPRCKEMVVAVLAILKAGGAYVPMEPSIPTQRKLMIIEDTNAQVVVTTSVLTQELVHNNVTTLALDEAPTQDWPTHSPNLPVDSRALAYIIFTSGSTGKPKGVMLQHDPVVNLIHWVNRSYQVGADDCLLFIAALSFDLSVYDIFGILACGGSLYLADDEEKSDPVILVELIEQQDITFWDSAPAALMQLTEFMPAKGSDKLRLVFLSGDWIPLSLPPTLQQIYRNLQVVGLGGATEAAIWSNFFNVKELQPFWRSIPYGLPITNARYYILDKDLLPCQIGVTGNLYIGGPCLSYGYFNQPELTACRYLPDPYATEAGGVLYNTGDQARRMHDGQIEFIGRVDNQVKLRGFRIELGEIDAVLKQDSRVREVVSMVREDRPGVKKLVVYLLLHQPSQTMDLAEARNLVCRQLPEYMAPSAVVTLDTWPTTANGKLDRGALPMPIYDQSEDYVEPEGETEQQLAQLYQDLLGVEKIGRFDNFFELGGDSIISVQLVTRARRLGLNLSPRDVFQSPSIAAMAEVLLGKERAELAEQNAIGKAVITPVQHWYLAKEPKYLDHFNQMLRLKLTSKVDVALLQQALNLVYHQHDVLSARLTQNQTENSSQWQSTIIPAACRDMIHLQQIDLRKQAQPNQTIDELHQSLNLSSGPGIAAAVLEMSDTRQELLLLVHHFNIDGVSWRFIVEDLELAYLSLVNNKAVEFDPKTASYLKWTQALDHLAQQKHFDDQLTYWEQQHCNPSLILPCKSETPNASAFEQKQVKVKLSRDLTEQLLRQSCKLTNATMEELLLGALVLTLNPAQQQGLTIELESYGRNPLSELPDISRTCGWFTAIHPLHVPASEVGDIANVIMMVKESLRRVPDGGIGYGVLKYLANKDELIGASKQQLTFNYLGQFDNAFSGSQLFQLSDEYAGKAMNDDDHLLYLLEVSCQIRFGQLEVEWNYSSQHFSEQQAQAWAEQMQQQLHNIAQFAQDLDKPLHSAMDYPLATMTQQTCQSLQQQYSPLEDVFNLTPMQQGLLYHTLSSTSSNTYIGQYLFEIQGELNVAAFKQAWQEVCQRHVMLRSRFVLHDDGQYQVVLSQDKLLWQALDWSDANSEQQQELLDKWQQEQQEQAFVLSEQPAIRFGLMRSAENHYYFGVSFHHIIVDGWSLAVLNRDAALLYQGFCDDKPVQLPPVAAINHYLHWLQQQSSTQAMNYWRDMLADVEQACVLPEWREVDSNIQSGTVVRHLTKALTANLTALARNNGLTVNTFMQAAWGLVLSHFSATQDVIFGVTVAGRPTDLANVDQMVGLFINTLPMRLNTYCDIDVLTWLQQIQRQQMDSSHFEHTPLVDIQKCSGLPAGQGLFDSYVVFENFPDDPDFIRQTTGLDIQGKEANFRGSYPLAVQVNPGEAFEIKGIYEPSKLNGDTVAEYIDHMLWVLAQLSENLSVKVSQLPTIKQQQAQLLQQNLQTTTQADWIKRFEQQVLERPEQTALVCGQARYNYLQLNQKANQLANYLITQAIGIDDRVTILLERSADYVIAILACNKVNAAFVPLNPKLPVERMRYVVESAEAKLVLCDQSCLSIATQLGVSHLALDSEPSPWADLATSNPQLTCVPQALAYILFTSGSTGMPKGVMIEQRQLTHYVESAVNRLQFTAGMKHAHLLPFDGDGGYTMVFPALASGGELHVMLEHELLDPVKMGQNMVEQGIHSLKIPPSYLQALMTDASDNQMLPNKRLLLGMEVSHSPHYRTLELAMAEQQGMVFNHYGPTEATIGVVTYHGEQPLEVLRADQTAPLGQPMSHAGIYILDQQLRPVPPGYAGEIFISGYSLARGYLNNPQLTAEKFLPDPFSPISGMRMYSTGDLGRFMADGSLAFLGRFDHQVKVRGHRVELQGIDATLKQCTQIQSCITVALELHGQQTLASYLVCAKGHQPMDKAQIVEHLEQTLPAYSIPEHYVYLEQLPLTRAGKVDRKALPEPHTQAATPAQALSTPLAANSKALKVMKQIWAEVLVKESIDATDNFFALGGDSIKAIMAVGKAKAAGYDITPQQLFEFHQLADLAAYLDDQQLKAKAQALLTIWQEVLGNDEITVDDNFFARGGDSIKAIMVVAKAKALGYDITPQQLFEFNSLADLVAQLDVLAAKARAEELLVIFKEVLAIENLTIDDNFFGRGGDSIKAIMVVAKAKNLGYHLAPQQLFEFNTLKDLAANIEKQTPQGMSEQLQQASFSGPMPLLPSQRRFFAQPRVQYHNFVQTIILDVESEIELEQLQSSIDRLANHHGALRTTYRQQDGQWQCHIGQSHAIDCSKVSLEQAPDSAWLNQCGRDMAASLDIHQGQLMRLVEVVWPQGALLIWQAHHLIVDGMSWHILVEELETLLSDSDSEQAPSLGPIQTDLVAWSEALQRQADGLTEQSRQQWLLPDGRLSQGEHGGLIGDEGHYEQTLDATVTSALLNKANDNYKTDTQILLLSAFSLAVNQVLQQPGLNLMLEYHGRDSELEQLQNRELVGWFTNAFPMHLQTNSNDVAEVIKTTKESLRKIEGHSLDYPLWRYLRSDHGFTQQVDVLFHYMGELSARAGQQGRLSLSDKTIGNVEPDNEIRPYALLINAKVDEGQLSLQWSYDTKQLNPMMIQSLAAAFAHECAQIVSHCESAEAQATPSDFKLAGLDQQRLDKLMKRYKKN